MPKTLLELLLAPALVAISTLAARRHGPRVGGVVSALPAIVGPVLLIASQEHGTAFASKAANGTLVGLVALSGFALAYGRVASSTDWPLSIAAGWALATALSMTVYLGAEGLGSPWGFVLGGSSLLVALQALPRGGGEPCPSAMSLPGGDLPWRMALTAALVAMLTLVGDRFGPFIGGALAALPVLASVLAVFTHRQQGSAALLDLLRGMLTGMVGFVAFCQVIAVLIVPAGAAITFLVASVVAGALATLSAAGPIDRYARAGFG